MLKNTLLENELQPHPTGGRSPSGVALAILVLTELRPVSVQGEPNGVWPPQPALIELHCGWLKVLKVSKRNWTVECSPLNQGASKSLSRARSQLFRPGPVSTLRPI